MMSQSRNVSARMGELTRSWRVSVVVVALFSLAFIAWKSASPTSDWMGEHLAEFLGAVASAVALAFIAYSANIQARQTAARRF